MPKLKTNKRAKVRLRVTGTGKLMRMKGNASHLRRKKPARVRRQYSDKLPVSTADRGRMKKLLPYGS